MYKFTINELVAAVEFKRFSPREREVLCAILQNEITIAACVRLNLSAKTFSTYKARILEKLKLVTERELIYWAVTCGLLNGEPVEGDAFPRKAQI